ncbi:alpha/beta hydrolase [Alkalihalobacterium elongatum]|uniref:alpha/beta hydrolase n=1 Tax=Alkalihalobacterium elongatum TaxID=2675466 RepID=UPI001C1FE43A|nr:alpha/beta hydrolase [Alkalihalobacterium elongatum]
MTLDPQAKSFLDQLTQAEAPAVNELTVEQNRASTDKFKYLGGVAEEVAKVQNTTVSVDDTEINIRIYTPEGTGPFPVFIYFHGGGWVIGDLDVVDTPLRAITNRAEAIVVSVDYRLAPEHRFPIAPEDCYAATKWVYENISKFNGDPDHIAIGGDSAGGNLAAVVSLMAKDRGGPNIAYQVLIYPATDFAKDTPSHRENGEGYFLTKGAMDWFANHYINEDQKSLPYASPLLATDFTNLPPALVITAEFDPLRDEGETYAARLNEAGVPAEVTRYDGMIHGFFWMAGIMRQGQKAVEQVGNWLKKSFKG